MNRKLELILRIIEEARSERQMSVYRRNYLSRQAKYIRRHVWTMYTFHYTTLKRFCPETYNKTKPKPKNECQIIKQRKERVYQKALSRLYSIIDENGYVCASTSKGAIYFKPLIKNGLFWKTGGIGEKLKVSGIYFLYKNRCLMYIGASENIRARLKHHRKKNKIKFDSFKIYPIKDTPLSELFIAEDYYIQTLNPLLNIKGKIQ